MPQFELVIPAYNEAPALPQLIDRVVSCAENAGLSPEDFQLVVVENGSTDDSAEVLRVLELTALGRWFRTVNVVKNEGYGNGIMHGLITTTAPLVGWTHADLQCDPRDAFTAFNLLKNESDGHALVKGWRTKRLPRDRFISWVFDSIVRLVLGMHMREINAQPKVFPRTLLTKLGRNPDHFSFDLYALFCAQRAGYRIQTIPVRMPPRPHGNSKWAASFSSRMRTILQTLRYLFILRFTEGRA